MAQKGKNNNSIIIKGTPDYPLMVITLVLLLIGLVMLLSASTPSSLAETGDSYSIFRKQASFAIVGTVIALGISFFNYRIIESKFIQRCLYVLCIVMTLSVLVLGVSSGGARRWITIPGLFTFQPSEIIKIAIILFYAGYLPTLKDKVKNTNGFIKKYWNGFLWPIILIGALLVSILVIQNHLSVCILIFFIVGAQMLVSGMINSRFVIASIIILLILGLFAGAVYGIYSLVNSKNEVTVEETEESGFNFRSERIKVWLDPDSNLTGTGWQINQSFYAIGSGGLFGVGLGNSNQKNLYIPEPHNDFIFAVVAEEIGFVGCVFIIFLFIMFIWRGLIIAMNASDMEGTLLAVGATTLIGMEAIINIAVVTGTIPVTGMALPFFSYGGTALVVNLIAVGLLISVSRKN